MTCGLQYLSCPCLVEIMAYLKRLDLCIQTNERTQTRNNKTNGKQNGVYTLDRLLLSNVGFSLAHIITKEGLSSFIIMG